MLIPILLLGGTSFILSLIVTRLMISLAPKFGFVDKPGGRKIHEKPKPLLGGVGIFAGFVLPLLIGLLYVFLSNPQSILNRLNLTTKSIAVIAPTGEDTYEVHPIVVPDGERNAALWSGARQQMPLVVGLLVTITVMHVMGLFDDRKALGPFLKLFIQLGATAALVITMEYLARETPSLRLRVLTALDKTLGLGPWPSIVLTVLWIGAITNAFNFLDNMDGLSAGVGAVCTTAFLITALLIQQWFVAASLALLLGSLLGFLVWNFPPAKIFMGDSGSLLIGLILGILTVRTTYLPPERQNEFAAGWYSVFAPVIVLAMPLYDLIVVSAIRISRGKSPFIGDTNHFSHRLVARGMSKRTAVLTLYLVTAATAIAAILLPHVRTTFAAMLIFAQTMLVLCLVALLEQHPLPRPAQPLAELPPDART